MRRPSDPRIEILVFDLEINIESKQHFCFQITQDVLSHLPILLALVLVLLGALAYLDAGRVEGSVLVLPRAYKDDILEPLKALKLAQLVEARVLNVFGVAHTQLRQ